MTTGEFMKELPSVLVEEEERKYLFHACGTVTLGFGNDLPKNFVNADGDLPLGIVGFEFGKVRIENQLYIQSLQVILVVITLD